jgi:hypothetical protein
MDIIKECLTLVLYLCMGYTFLMLIFMITLFME